VLSGLPSAEFLFIGFLPAKKGRNRTLETLAGETRTMIIYESPHKLVRTLNDLSQVLGGNRHASVSRELTKLHEETVRGVLEEIVQHFGERPPKGEMVIVIAGSEERKSKKSNQNHS
jgi:16S rRNA (cytidine1402-2'-O)-methyltransferase